MNLKEQLNQKAKYKDKYTREEIVKILNEEAGKGVFTKEFNEIDVFESDMYLLKEENLKVEYFRGQDYNYWVVSWE